MQEERSWFSFAKRFPKTFWIVVLFFFLTLFIVFAIFYVMYASAVMGFDWDTRNALRGVSYLVLLLPPAISIFAGPAVDALGYRKMLVGGFLALLVASCNAPAAGHVAVLVFAALFLCVGEGLIYPVLFASIGRLTSAQDRVFAFAFTFWLVYTPFMVLQLLVHPFGRGGIYALLGLAVVLIIIGIILGLLLLRLPPLRYGPPRLSAAFTAMGRVLAQPAILLLLVVLSLFWYLGYGQFDLMNAYLGSSLESALALAQYGEPLAWTLVIIYGLAGFVLANLMDRADPLKFIMSGGTLMVIGIAIAGLYFSTPLLFIGLIIFVLGDFIVAPAALGLVSQQAHPRTMGGLMGLMFIPPLFGALLHVIVEKLFSFRLIYLHGLPHVYMGIMIAIGCAAIALLILHYLKWGRRLFNDTVDKKWSKQARRDLRGPRKGAYKLAGPFQTRQWEQKRTVVIFVILAPIMLALGFAGGTGGLGEEEDDGPVMVREAKLRSERVSYNASEVLDEGSNTMDTFYVSMRYVYTMDAVMVWDTDEGSDYPGGTNEPDEMGLVITSPDGRVFDGGTTYEGRINMDQALGDGEYENTGDWTIEVICGDCGDDHGPLGFMTSADDSCEYYLTVEFEGEEWSR